MSTVDLHIAERVRAYPEREILVLRIKDVSFSETTNRAIPRRREKSVRTGLWGSGEVTNRSTRKRMIFYMEDVTEQEMHEVARLVYLFGDFKRRSISYSTYRNWQYYEFKFCKKYIDYIKPTLKYKPGVFTMHQLETSASAFLERKLPQRLITELTHLAGEYRGKGVRLFIFGSFARSDNRRASDLDLGVLWTKQRVSRIFTELYRDVQELPTIRKIDLVDMEQVDDRFKKEALKDALFLLEDETSV